MMERFYLKYRMLKYLRAIYKYNMLSKKLYIKYK